MHTRCRLTFTTSLILRKAKICTNLRTNQQCSWIFNFITEILKMKTNLGNNLINTEPAL